MTLDGVMSFSRFKNMQNTCKSCITVKIVAGFLYVMAENWKNLKVLTAFFIVFFFFVCWNRNRSALVHEL